MRKTETYHQFVGTLHKTKKLPTTPPKPANTLIPSFTSLREVEEATDSEDFDPEAFDAWQYFWDAVLLRTQPTAFKLLYALMFWQTVFFFSLSVYNLMKSIWLRVSPLNYFDMLGPAFIDMSQLRYQQRLSFKVLEQANN